MKHLIAGNWKMNGDRALAKSLAAGLAAKAGAKPNADIVLCPPAPLLQAVAAAVSGSALAIGAQDCHADEKGAHTGDVSAWLLKDIGCSFVIVGHSERRADHGETDAVVKAKAAAALQAGLTPIVCVGETEAERERGETARVIARQLTGSIPDLGSALNLVVAYEPVWAIGTGKTGTTADIAAVHAQIREVFAAAGGAARSAQAGTLRILYGGSVKGSNAASILATPG
ncbi:MAG: triose-phosphate isomerase, partial [Rhodospirillaceae bacterium]|nr:triose-phosphate isomerase [Rhodospirillaceae bacterium]